jgi:hypothetical protein
MSTFLRGVIHVYVNLDIKEIMSPVNVNRSYVVRTNIYQILAMNVIAIMGIGEIIPPVNANKL